MNDMQSLPGVVDVETIAGLLRQQAPIKIIDVRTPAEWESAHIPGSYNVPLDMLPEHRAELRDILRAPAILVCRSGARARQAEQVLRQADLPQVHVLDGGIAAWEAAGKPVNRGRQRWGMERQVRGIAGTLVVLGALGGTFVWQPLTYLSAFVGGGLAFSALTDTCGMAMILSKLPYNRAATCDVRDVVSRLATEGAAQPTS
jgi:rhodanese-related sulfurtransferase